MARHRQKPAGGADPRRGLPSVSVLLEEPRVQSLIDEYSRPELIDAINDALEWFRRTLEPDDSPPDADAAIDKVGEMLRRNTADRLRRVVNATGIILHTGLGRAVLPRQAVDALAQLSGCCNLQIDIETGRRGKRNYMTERLLAKLTGAEAAMIVNNNAAATLLILTALCKEKEVIVSRGQLIEIGGSFRLPDCIHQSGAVMVEVGTTNKTHLRDYEAALSENTSAILRVNPSNYRIIGFSQQVPIAELVTLKKKQPVIVIDDLGCGALLDMEQFGLPHEPTASESIVAGADVVCFSGDKLISGPQAGLIVGKKELIDRIRKHPLTRMLRVGKLTDAALEHTLRLFLDPETLLDRHPTLRMVTTSAQKLKQKAARMKRQLDKKQVDVDVRVEEDESGMGGGSLPGVPIPTYVLAVRAPKLSADRLSYLLRQNDPPIITRIKDDDVLLDMRTLLEDEDKIVVKAIERIASQ